MKSNVPADEAGSDGYITFPVKYKYKDGCTLAEMRYILFTSEILEQQGKNYLEWQEKNIQEW